MSDLCDPGVTPLATGAVACPTLIPDVVHVVSDVSVNLHVQDRGTDGSPDISVSLHLRIWDICNIWGSTDIGGFLGRVGQQGP